MRNRISFGRWIIVLFLAVACLSPTAALASNKGVEVPCRVDSNTVALTVFPETVAYGMVELGTTQDTTVGGVNQTLTATNTGTEAVNLTITSSHATTGTQWTLAATVGENLFTHKASLNDGSTWPIVMTDPAVYVALASGVASLDTVDFDLQIGMPLTSSDYQEKTITVTIQAVAS